MTTEQGKKPTIFLVEEDDDTRAGLKHNLTKEGYRLLPALDEQDAMERISGGGVAADLVLINLVGKPVEEALRVGRRIREQAKLDGRTPLVVMPEKYGKDVEGTNVNVDGNDWILYLGEELEQLQNILARLIL